MALCNVYKGLLAAGDSQYYVRGDYTYFHYGIDGFNDKGWGCGYRTLQSLCSWVRLQKRLTSATSADTVRDVPSIPDIQRALVDMGDKPATFVGSRDWIGSFEVCLCLDHFYDVPCKIIHITTGHDLTSHLDGLAAHFRGFGSPLMMGGDSDSASKGILGVCLDPPSLLVMDPHYSGNDTTSSSLQKEGWLSWRPLDTFMENSFYNICLPQLKASDNG